MGKFFRVVRNNKGFILFVVLYALTRTAYADWSRVPTPSMEPTIYPGDYLLVDKTAFGPSIPFLNIRLMKWGAPQPGDIITFVPPHTDDLYVKRVIGVPGDEIIVDDANIFLNGELLSQEFFQRDSNVLVLQESLGTRQHQIQFSLKYPVDSALQQITVPEGHYFVMGDHRNNSVDSRDWGFVDENNINGKVNRLVLSFAHQRRFFDSIGKRIN